uniref:TFIIS N-terminal domain-containing protein n=1 Tax=Acrobeloides nanus TaxID=290746 RepID=A0A914CC52_9BILA
MRIRKMTKAIDDEPKFLRVEEDSDVLPCINFSDDRNANAERRPAIQKRKMLPVFKNALLKADFFDALLDNGMMSAVSEWLAPLPDKSLPALEIRSMLLKILSGFPTLEQGILKQSGLGKAVMFLFKHPKETRENKNIAAKLTRNGLDRSFRCRGDREEANNWSLRLWNNFYEQGWQGMENASE